MIKVIVTYSYILKKSCELENIEIPPFSKCFMRRSIASLLQVPPIYRPLICLVDRVINLAPSLPLPFLAGKPSVRHQEASDPFPTIRRSRRIASLILVHGSWMTRGYWIIRVKT